jgi:hypothetical protein
MNPDSHDLIQRHMAGLLTADEADVLQTRLKADTDLRRLYLHYMNLDVALEAQAGSRDRVIDLLRASPLTETKPSGRWLSWRPLAAAAAGIVFGMFCTAMAFGYVAPLFRKTVTLLETSFENIPTPTALGVPTRAGEWNGDYAEIVGAQKGVTPRSGSKMWRFLRADNALPATERPSRVGEAIHVVDLKPLRSAGAQAGSQIEIGAWFAQGPTAPAMRFTQAVKAAAFQGSITDAPELWADREQSSACLAQREMPAPQMGRWQWVSVTMILPPDADFLVFECVVVQRRPALTEGVAEFPAQYVDDVRVCLLQSTHDAQPPD